MRSICRTPTSSCFGAAAARSPRTKPELRRSELETQRQRLREASEAATREIADLAARWERLQQERGQATGRSTLDELRAELARFEAEIQRTLNAPVGPALLDGTLAVNRRVWKASDALAQLTGGQLTQIRVSGDGRARDDCRSSRTAPCSGRSLTATERSALPGHWRWRWCLRWPLTDWTCRWCSTSRSCVKTRPAPPPWRACSPSLPAKVGRRSYSPKTAMRCGGSSRLASPSATLMRCVAVSRQSLRQPRLSCSRSPPSQQFESSVNPWAKARRLRRSTERVPAPLDKPLYYLTVDASMADFPVLGNDTAVVFSTLGLRTVEDLLAADADDVARRLAHPAVSADAVRLWQQHTSLMCFVPGVSLADAQVLAACDVTSPEALFSIDVRLLADAVSRFLATERGRRFASSQERLSRDRLALLQKHARRQRDRWQLLCPRYSWVERLAEPPKRKAATNAKTQPSARGSKPRPTTPAPAPRLARGTKRRPLRFLLDRTSPVAQAPSIRKKLAERLAQVGVRTVADLLNANPESTAEEIGLPRVTAATISRWQSQSRLACRIPELHSLGARILVACGLAEAEQIAATTAAELTPKVRALCRTPEGKRLLRGRKAPSAARIAGWIRHATQMRPLEAA